MEAVALFVACWALLCLCCCAFFGGACSSALGLSISAPDDIKDARSSGRQIKLVCGFTIDTILIPLWMMLLPAAFIGCLVLFVREELALEGAARVAMFTVAVCIAACGCCLASIFCCAMPHLNKDQLRQAFNVIDGEISQVLHQGTIRLLSCAWLIAQPLTCMSRLQDLPEEAFFSKEKAAAAFGGGRVFVVSYGWLTAEHPDPHGIVLRCIINFLNSSFSSAFDFSEWCLFWDFASLPQRSPTGAPRSEAETVVFKEALFCMSKLYGSLYRTVVLQITKPPVTDQIGYNMNPYHRRGWCIMEEAAACIAAFHGHSRSPPKLMDISGPEPHLHDPKKEGKPDLAAIESNLDSGIFTGAGDKDVVMKQLKDFNALLCMGGQVVTADVVGRGQV